VVNVGWWKLLNGSRYTELQLPVSLYQMLVVSSLSKDDVRCVYSLSLFYKLDLNDCTVNYSKCFKKSRYTFLFYAVLLDHKH